MLQPHPNLPYNAPPQYNQQQIERFQAVEMAQRQRQEELKQVKLLDDLKRLKKSVRKEEIIESIIKPEKINVDRTETRKIESKLREAEGNLKAENNKTKVGGQLAQYWKKRTNQPYKNIMKDENYDREFKKQDDLVVHKVTEKDKDVAKLEAENSAKKHELELQTKNLKEKVYSAAMKSEHKKNFEYEHVFKYRRLKENKAGHSDMKTKHDRKLKREEEKHKMDRQALTEMTEYYKKEQQRMEANRVRDDEIIETIIDDGAFMDRDSISSDDTTQSRPKLKKGQVVVAPTPKPKAEEKSAPKRAPIIIRKKSDNTDNTDNKPNSRNMSNSNRKIHRVSKKGNKS
jgi:hypothetical protein